MPNIQDVCKAARIGDLKALITLHKLGTINLNETAEWFEPHSLWNPINWPKSRPSAVIGPMTPLMVAVTYGHFNCVEYLVNTARVDINVKGGRRNDLTSLDCAHLYTAKYAIAGTSTAEKIVDLLTRKGAKFDDSGIVPQALGAVFAGGQISNYIIKKGTDISRREVKREILQSSRVFAPLIGCSASLYMLANENPMYLVLFILSSGTMKEVIEQNGEVACQGDSGRLWKNKAMAYTQTVLPISVIFSLYLQFVKDEPITKNLSILEKMMVFGIFAGASCIGTDVLYRGGRHLLQLLK